MSGVAPGAVGSPAMRPGDPAAGGIGPARGRIAGTRPVGSYPQDVPASDFATEFRRQLEGIQFSQHARQRMESRGIPWGPRETAKLAGAVGTLALKGGRTSLVLLDDVALVVSVPNRTVITAVQGPEEAVFTNIDSAIRL